jgi:nitrite reductase (NADH) large subunit
MSEHNRQHVPARRLVIVGNGMTTDRLLDELIERREHLAYDITVIGEEPYGAYNRILLAAVMRGGDPDLVTTKPPSWYIAHGITFLGGTLAVSIDTETRVIYTDDGRSVSYDRAVLATGSTAAVPGIEYLNDPFGGLRNGVHVFRTMDDALRLRDEALAVMAQPGPFRAIVIGGGLLGLEAAETLVRMGVPVCVLHPFEELLNTQLDEAGGRLLRGAVERLGIEVVVGSARAVAGFDRVTGVVLDDGGLVAGQMVVCAVGVRPRIDLAAKSGIVVDRGIVVGDQLETSAPGVYAVGECAQYRGRTVGLVQPCWEQAEVLADVLTNARPGARYAAGEVATRLKLAGLDVASMGIVDGKEPEDEVVQIVEARRGRYRKLIVRDGRLVGAVLVGAPDATARLVQVFLEGHELPPEPLDLLCSPDAFVGEAAGTSCVCSCNQVSRETLVAAIEDGCETVDQLKRATRAGTGCGSCTIDLNRLLDQHATPVAIT